MTEAETRAAASRLRSSIKALVESESAPMIPPVQEEVIEAALALAEGVIVNFARIADALERLSRKDV